MAYEGANLESGGRKKDFWLKVCQDAYERSTNYFDNNYRKNWEDGLRMFQSKHPTDSKYNSDAYKYRSRVFRPKTRSVVRRHEAVASLAFFSNPDLVSIDPAVSGNKEQAYSAYVMRELIQQRLTKSIPWFLTVIGGFQDAMTVGLVASFNYWKYRSKKQKVEKTGFIPGLGPVQVEVDEDVPVEDKPVIDLIPIENIRFDPAAKFYDVVGTSPYIIVQMPMYVGDILDRVESGEWNKVTKEQLLQASVDDSTLRQARTGGMEDEQQQQGEVKEFDVVCVHLNFIRKDGEIYTYFTLKDILLLTKPRPIAEVFLHGEIPITIGFCMLETHKAVPTAPIIIGRDLQTEANHVANARLDNVFFVLNKRWVLRRGANVDTEALMRNVPGGAVMAGDVDKDVREISWNDVTSSSYQEQDRINVDYDELLGSFAQSSVMTNRKLNETVGGMKIMAQGANALTEYTLKLFVETWMEPTLRQLMKLEAYYETDEVLLAVAQDKASSFIRGGQNPDIDSLLQQDMILNVNMGMGATDPDTRFQRFLQANGAYMQLATQGPPDLDLKEARKELYSLAGFKDSARFFQDEVDPKVAMLQKQMQEIQQQAVQFVEEKKDEFLKRDRALDAREDDLDVERIELDADKKLLALQIKVEDDAGKDLDRIQKDNQFTKDLNLRREVEDNKLKSGKEIAEENVASVVQEQLEPVISGTVDIMRQGVTMLAQALNNLATSIRAGTETNESLQDAVDKAAKAFTAPRTLVRDDKGRPAGSKTIN